MSVPADIPADLADAFATVKGRALPPHCPYRSGDPVKRHGYARHPAPGFRRTGFRGWVVATVGATILTGITTSGEEWWEEWGHIEPADTPVNLEGHCACCREERTRARHAARERERSRGEQLDLFEVPA